MLLRGTHEAVQLREYQGYVWVQFGTQETRIAPEVRWVRTHQEYPADVRNGSVWLSSGTPPQPTVDNPRKTILTIQELPWKTEWQFLWYGHTPTNPIPVPVPRSDAITRQETPFHPSSVFNAGKQGPDVAPILNILLTTQEIPHHPSSIVRVGLGGLAVKSPGDDFIIVPPETPTQPGSFLLSSFIPALKPQLADYINNRQEAPYHPNSWLFNPIGIRGTVQPEMRRLFSIQEYPQGHPYPITRFNMPLLVVVDTEFSWGYILGGR